ncbi:uncharacterized protein RMCC_4486 [Mycolicibacterium canariasense]|uniref:Uncharacterized protein n=1 Tax=Mycolicibacterium canariasense TaxID=228230 RepID=A0A117IB94_MYCCR|nr:hypothetical protein [Mycolicibacterium canariasense]MCV7210713.1 hypothetical protein [Mycolicibacterium canariasense]ORU98310.1 hypothetical protein AWB94_28655 [Mycolicibacterium canariasense]GAS97520.1 uncharacterized protein RMCC_4486 [Mycolicibacterium canariasense]
MILASAGLGVALTTLAAGIAAADTTVMPFTSTVRACDYTPAERTWATGYARPLAHLHTDGNTLAVDVELLTARPDTQYFVRVFQMPRASNDCAVAPVPLQTDGAGNAYATIRSAIDPGATGAWVSIERPSDHSQQPAEAYTSDFIAKI